MNVQGITQRSVERGALFDAEMTNGIVEKKRLRNGKNVVASDDAGFWESFLRADCDLRANPADRARDWCAGHRR